MSKKIPISEGVFAVVDDEDFERVSRISWSLHSAGYATGYDPDLYASGQPSHKALVLMHRYVLGCEPGDGVRVDHRNHNKLDNRRKNLRAGTNSENMLNRARTIREEFSSQYRGVAHRGRKEDGKVKNDRGYWYTPSKPWVANYGKRYLGIFASQEEAARFRDAIALNEEGPEAQLNFPLSNQEVSHV